MTEPDTKANKETAKNTGSRPCPICSKPSVVSYRPFCSKRCADIDLHRWLAGGYAIPVTPEADDEDMPDPASLDALASRDHD
ncbi:MAG TPA: DNA gyrase inhibitor YacG [Methylovirgula sp.]|jgi:endogenous inhibitor of DNA gyrase (YacG/DUF329 family)|nr:DNA gyrase inhibitor YacG [Methylovirgula sp.]